MVELKAFDKFENTTDALRAAKRLVKSKLPKGLRKFLRAQCQEETLAIADSELGEAISEKLVSRSWTFSSPGPPVNTVSGNKFLEFRD